MVSGAGSTKSRLAAGTVASVAPVLTPELARDRLDTKLTRRATQGERTDATPLLLHPPSPSTYTPLHP